MRKLLAMIALVAPLTAAPLAFGADDPDASFYKNAAEAGIFEVEAANQAQQKATMQSVKDFAAMMVKDHTAANDQLKTLAASKNISLPTSASVSQMAEKAKLDVLTGETYDKSYIKGQIKPTTARSSSSRRRLRADRTRMQSPSPQQTLPTLATLEGCRDIATQNGWTKAKASPAAS